jgi:RHS repeat-associated protein
LNATQLELDTLQYDARHELVANATRRYDYDASGNRVAVRNLSGGLLDSLSFQAGRSRVYQRFTPNRQLWKTYGHSGDGARTSESSVAVPGGFERLYYYNTVGEMTGHRWVYGTAYDSLSEQLVPLWAGGATRCTYDALGRRTNSCGGGSGLLGFDGDNVVRAEMIGYGYARWRYVHGPGLDDPLVAVHAFGSEQPKYYYVTDGRGRHLAFTDSTGTNFMEPESYGGPEHSRYYQEGGNQAGSVESSHGFENVRAGSEDAPQLSYYRNRYYDQQTGRFINEDPIGVAGGTNLYQYGGNNPATFTDPFGLCPYDGGTRTTNLEDCPKDRRLDVFRVLETTRLGRYFIGQFVSRQLNLELHPGPVQCGAWASADGCSNVVEGTMVLNSRRTASAIASNVVHEITHSMNWGASADPQSMIVMGSFVGDEMAAYALGWTFYNGLPRRLRNDDHLNYMAGMYRNDPYGAMRLQCITAGYGAQCGDW